MQIELLSASDPARKKTWHDAWESLPNERRDVYFRPEYLAANEAEGRGKALCFLAREGQALLLHPFLLAPVPGLTELGMDSPLFDIQTPYGYGGPVVNPGGEDSAFLERAWSEFSNWCRASHVIAEFCRFHPLLQNERWASASMRVVPNRPTVYIDLQAYPQNFACDSFYRNHRQMTNRAIRAGEQSQWVPTSGEMERFAESYAKTQDVLQAGSETRLSADYFTSLTSGLGGAAKLRVGRRGKNETLRVLFLESGDFIHGHFMAYGSAPPPSGSINVLLHEVALDAAQRGLKILHLGGGRTPDPNDSLLAYKSRLSPRRTQFSLGMRLHLPEAYEDLKLKWENKFGLAPKGFFLFYRGAALSRPASGSG